VRDTFLPGITLISPSVGAQILRNGENSRDLHLGDEECCQPEAHQRKRDVHMPVIPDPQRATTMRNMITVAKKDGSQGAGRCLSDINVNTHHTDDQHRQ